MQLRVADVEDIDEILRLHDRYQIDSLCEAEKKDGFIAIKFNREHLLALIIEEQGIFIALQEETIVAYVMAGSWGFWKKWPIFAFMVKGFPNVSYRGKRLSEENSYQYGPVCVDKSVRGSGVFEAIYHFSRKKMSLRYSILITFINKLNTRSYHAHVHKLGMEVLQEFEFKGGSYYELAHSTL